MAEEEKESGRSFRVADRRRFASILEESQPGDESSDEPSDRAEAPRFPSEEEQRASSSSRAEARQTVPPPHPEISFSSFILGLSTQALMYMGEIPSVPGQPGQTDLSAAQQMIDVLAMLKQKTTGNLDAGEEAMLGNALFDLRMRYIELARKNREGTKE